MESVYANDKIAAFGGNDVEVFCEEVLKVNNKEAVYTDLRVQTYFSMEDLGKQEIFNVDSLETSPLNTCANYRNRIQVDYYTVAFVEKS